MKVKMKDLWKYDGCTIHLTEKIVKESIRPGNYVLLGRDINDLSLTLLGNSIIHNLYEYDDEDEIMIMDSDFSNRVDNLVEGHTVMNINLIGDGWTCKKQGQLGLDLAPYIEQLESYITLKNVINCKD